MARWGGDDVEPTEVHVHGDGLLQHLWKKGDGVFSDELHEIADQTRRRL